MTADHRFLHVDRFADGRIVRIALNRPETRNAQNRGLLVELDQAFSAAAADPTVRVVILRGHGRSFSSGHDLGSSVARGENGTGAERHPSRDLHGGTRAATERRMLQEWHYFFDNTMRWRELDKVTIAEVHGQVFAAGLMLMWACDLIVAADDTQFVDVVGTRLGMCGVEYFAHPWEMGPRRAKEMLLTGDYVGAQSAERWGMINCVVPAAELEQATLSLAAQVAEHPPAKASAIKQIANRTADHRGFLNALRACFSLHQLNHAHWAELSGSRTNVGTPEFGLPDWRQAPPIAEADHRAVGAGWTP
ncbi:MAG TPA: enoyl-CoA hydratase [Ilumatobacter sp.]|nr:enoyl-CoA hydratase [Ilumatobacter sp.]